MPTAPGAILLIIQDIDSKVFIINIRVIQGYRKIRLIIVEI